jgi:hypothetical protein
MAFFFIIIIILLIIIIIIIIIVIFIIIISVIVCRYSLHGSRKGILARDRDFSSYFSSPGSLKQFKLLEIEF